MSELETDATDELIQRLTAERDYLRDVLELTRGQVSLLEQHKANGEKEIAKLRAEAEQFRQFESLVIGEGAWQRFQSEIVNVGAERDRLSELCRHAHDRLLRGDSDKELLDLLEQAWTMKPEAIETRGDLIERLTTERDRLKAINGELVEALKLMNEKYAGQIQNDGMHGPALAKARAAIAKATEG